MHNTVKNLIYIEDFIKSKVNRENVDKLPKIIAVSKTFPLDSIIPLIEYGHLHYGENKVQEALDKWTEVKKKNASIRLHLIGRLQTNKVNKNINFNELSMGMSGDYLSAIKNNATYVRIGSKIFGNRD